MWERITVVWDTVSVELLIAGLSAALLLLLAVWLILHRRPAAKPARSPVLAVDVAGLEPVGPPSHGPRLEFYGTSVRLAVLVLAPVGRDGREPEPEQLLQILEQLVPGLQNVALSHQPIVRVWPGQLSSQGFLQAFFHKVPLPGDRGKGTPWCSLAGKFHAAGNAYLAGLVACAAAPNGLGQFEIQHEGQWNDVLRIKSA